MTSEMEKEMFANIEGYLEGVKSGRKMERQAILDFIDIEKYSYHPEYREVAEKVHASIVDDIANYMPPIE